MKKALLWIFGVVAIAICADMLLGRFCAWYESSHDLGGDYTSFSHIKNSFSEDGLVLGSSVALNSINTKVLGDSTGISFFNGSSNGQEFPFFITSLQTALSMHKPQIVLLGLVPQQFESIGMGQRYNFLAPYYHTGQPCIDAGLDSMAPESRYLMKSNLYRFNTIWFRILLYRFITPNEVGECGFIAKPIPAIFPVKKTVAVSGHVTDERIREFNQFIDICQANGIELIVFFPPNYHEFNIQPETIAVADSICRSRGVRMYDDTRHPTFRQDSTLFFDATHLNHDGAKIYTSIMHHHLLDSSVARQ